MGMRVSRRRALVSGVGAAVLALAVGACSSSGSSGGSSSSGSSSGTTSKSGKLTDVTLVIPSLSANQALGFIAQNGGYFKKNGLNVKIVNSGAGATAVAAVTGGSGQFVISGGSDILSAAAKGQEDRPECQLHPGREGQGAQRPDHRLSQRGQLVDRSGHQGRGVPGRDDQVDLRPAG
jgi:hypothetical protein